MASLHHSAHCQATVLLMVLSVHEEQTSVSPGYLLVQDLIPAQMSCGGAHTVRWRCVRVLLVCDAAALRGLHQHAAGSGI